MASALKLLLKPLRFLKEVATLTGHTFEFDHKRIGGVAIVKDGTPLPDETIEGRARTPTPFFWARLAAMSSILHARQTSVPRPAC
jgi:isocitrate/isopropylmalate dehydrogenase